VVAADTTARASTSWTRIGTPLHPPIEPVERTAHHPIEKRLSAHSPASATGPFELRPLQRGEHTNAAAVLARGMRDTPLSRAMHGPDPERRTRELRVVFAQMVRSLGAQTVCASVDGRIIGLAGLAPPGDCQATPRDAVNTVLALLRGTSPRATVRFARWRVAWRRRDPHAPHWHLGPVAVVPEWTGRGIGSAMMDAVCTSADAQRMALYLETDTTRNVRFYERWGFVLTGSVVILGTPTWLMWRAPRRREHTPPRTHTTGP
jgi:GNAT superfamily N-acetyltransferase